MAQYEIVARNFDESNENRIHSDEIAKKFGFKGALVPGSTLYGHLTLPLVDRFGADWLKHSVCDLRLIKPAYHEDRLVLSLSEADTTFTVQCHNASGELLATLVSSMPEVLPEPAPASIFDSEPKPKGRSVIAWDTVIPNEPFHEWQITVTEEYNQMYTEQVADELPLYKEGYAHPHSLCWIANTAMLNDYMIPLSIHVGVEARHRKAVKVGDTLTVRSVPLEKWKKKGHEFIRLYVSLWRGEELTTDIMSTTIFEIAI